jgi:uncharacterized protein (TIGR02145 family)
MNARVPTLILIIFSVFFIQTCRKDEVPVVRTIDVTEISTFTAISGGDVINEGSSSVFKKGVCWDIYPSPDISDKTFYNGDETDKFECYLSGLSSGTTYFIRAFATNSKGTGYGNELTFTTLTDQKPTVETLPATNPSLTSVVLNGKVDANGFETTVSFEYGETTGYGSSLTIDKVYSFNHDINIILSGLTKSTTYHFRIMAVSVIGTSYGSDASFTTLDSAAPPINFNQNLTYGSVADIEGNIYKTIKIGTQTWMAENLKATRYNDSTLLTNTYPVCVWYNDDSAAFKAVYGGLYTWPYIDRSSNGDKNVCPTGWHIPSDEDWTTLTDYLGGENVAAGKLKEAGSSHWAVPNGGATNESGFTALPGGFFGGDASLGNIGFWWSSSLNTEIHPSNVWIRIMYYQSGFMTRTYTKGGFSIRCIKDN